MASTATGKMYRVKPFFDSNTEIISNAAMYKVRSFESDMIGILTEGEVEDRVSKLQQRQQQVLMELLQLQCSVQMLAQERGITLKSTSSASVHLPNVSLGVASDSRISPVQGGLQDLVISADPSCVPLSLLVLLKQLSSQLQVLTSTFVHSSAVDTPQKLRTFLHNGPVPAPRCNYQLAVTLVWKKIPSGPHLMVSPTRQTSIQGEANIARYLSRLLQPAYDHADISKVTHIDELLDLIQQQLIWGNNKEQAAVLRTLNARLGKGSWLVGGDLSVADIVAWSALQGAKMSADAPANVQKWLQHCLQHPEFQEAVRFLSL